MKTKEEIEQYFINKIKDNKCYTNDILILKRIRDEVLFFIDGHLNLLLYLIEQSENVKNKQDVFIPRQNAGNCFLFYLLGLSLINPLAKHAYNLETGELYYEEDFPKLDLTKFVVDGYDCPFTLFKRKYPHHVSITFNTSYTKSLKRFNNQDQVEYIPCPTNQYIADLIKHGINIQQYLDNEKLLCNFEKLLADETLAKTDLKCLNTTFTFYQLFNFSSFDDLIAIEGLRRSVYASETINNKQLKVSPSASEEDYIKTFGTLPNDQQIGVGHLYTPFVNAMTYLSHKAFNGNLWAMYRIIINYYFESKGV